MKIIAIVGSFRENSFNHQLAQYVKQIIGEKASFDILEYKDVPLFNQDIEFPAPEAVVRVRKIIQSADAVWFFTPEYNHYFPGILKNLLDWLSRPISDTEPQVLNGKPAAISGITPGISGTGVAQDHLMTLISILNMKVMNKPRLAIPNAMSQINEQGKLIISQSADFVENQVRSFLEYVL